LQKWLRENYNINICIIYWDIDHIAYTYLVDATFSKYNIEVDDDTEYKSYEDALEEGLMIVLKLIK